MKQLANQWDAQLYSEKHSFVYDYGTALIDLLEPRPNERILDLGCGSGELTYKIRELANDVVGIDKSAEMIEAARSKFPLIKFQLGDASNFLFEEPFDAIFSNATLHWVVEHEKAIECMSANLKKGGRIALEFGGKDNVKAIIESLRRALQRRGYIEQSGLKLWYFPSISEYSLALESRGFNVVFAQVYDRPTELADTETGIKDWLSMFGGSFFEGVDENDVEEIKKEVQEYLRPALFKDGKWFADYKRIRIVAYR